MLWNIGLGALILGILAILLAIAYNRANAPVIEIVEKPIYIDKPEYITIKVPDPNLSKVVEVPIYIDRIIKVPIQVGTVTDTFTFFSTTNIGKDGISQVTVGASYQSVNSPYPEKQWCYARSIKQNSQLTYINITLGNKAGISAPVSSRIDLKDANNFGASVDALEAAKRYCDWYPAKSPISDIADAPPFVSKPPPDVPPSPEGGSGTGFFINENGYLLTNYHVVDGCESIWVDEGDNKIQAVIVKKDLNLDIAALRITKKTYDFARFGSARTGEDVMALGFPLGDILGKELKATKGNISSFFGFEGNKNYLQFTAPIQPGNSGGPLLNEGGYVVGINTAILVGEDFQNINFAIKGTSASRFLGKNSIIFEYADYDKPISSADIVDQGKKYTVKVLCYK